MTCSPPPLRRSASRGSVILAGERLAEVPGALTRGRRARRADRRKARLDPAPGRRARRDRGRARCRSCCRAGARSPTRPPAPRSPGRGAWPRCPPSRAATPARSSPPPPTARSTRWWWPASIPPTCPTRGRAGRDGAGRPFVVSLELRVSAVTDRADVVLPVAAVAEKPGTFVNWEGTGWLVRRRAQVPSDPRRPARPAPGSPTRWTCTWACPTPRRPAGSWRPSGRRQARTSQRHRVTRGPAGRDRIVASGRAASAGRPRGSGAAEALLATWHNLLDAGRMQDGEPNLAGTARPAVAKMSAATAAEIGVTAGAKVSVSTSRGAIRCRSRSRRCRTGWSGCRRTQRAARSGATSAPATAAS